MKTVPWNLAGWFGPPGVPRHDAGRTGGSRLRLLALAAVFVLPFVIGSGLFWSGWRPAVLRNHGELIQPPRALPPSAGALQGKWLLLVPVRDGCGQACQDTLQQLQRAHAALGKDQGRVRRVLVGSAPIRLNPELATLSPAADEAAWRSALDDYASAVFIADPLGNVMMRYGEPIDARYVLRDMERLLKYSWVR